MADAPGNTPSPPTDLITIPEHEFPDYYILRHSRRFPRHRLSLEQRDDPGAPLPSILPVDGREMQRRTVQHGIVHLALNHTHYFGPFLEHLTPPQNKLVLDVGSASGRWIEDVSEEMSHVPEFHGVEIVPRSPTETERVFYTVYDFQREGLNHRPASVDVVHARFQNFHILDWPGFLSDVARVLRPGGLFMSGELDLQLVYTNEQRWPATIHLYNRVSNAMHERGYLPDVAAGVLQAQLEQLPQFTALESRIISIPVGRAPVINDQLGLSPAEQLELSVLAMECLKSLSSSLKPFLLYIGMIEVEVTGLIEAHRRELEQENATMTYRMTWARRRPDE